jgi:hypothetical protein
MALGSVMTSAKLINDLLSIAVWKGATDMNNSGKYLIVGFLGIVGGGVLGSVVEIVIGNSDSGIVGIFGLIGAGIAVWRLNCILKR